MSRCTRFISQVRHLTYKVTTKKRYLETVFSDCAIVTCHVDSFYYKPADSEACYRIIL